MLLFSRCIFLYKLPVFSTVLPKKKKKEYIKYVNNITPLQNISEPLTTYHKPTVRKVASKRENIYRTNK